MRGSGLLEGLFGVFNAWVGPEFFWGILSELGAPDGPLGGVGAPGIPELPLGTVRRSGLPEGFGGRGRIVGLEGFLFFLLSSGALHGKARLSGAASSGALPVLSRFFSLIASSGARPLG